MLGNVSTSYAGAIECLQIPLLLAFAIVEPEPTLSVASAPEMIVDVEGDRENVLASGARCVSLSSVIALAIFAPTELSGGESLVPLHQLSLTSRPR
jgi:hypothetical protein